MSALLAFYAFAIGAIVGSFLNVVIYRWPREESLMFPASHCPHCSTPIKPYDNVPILAWLWLGGKCRACRAPIEIRYPIVELANALFYLALFLHTGLSFALLPLAAFVSMTIVLIYIDLDVQLLPDVIDYPGIVLGLLFGALRLGLDTPSLTVSESLVDAAIGAAAGAAIFTAIILIYWLVRRVEGMGWGDVKMIAMLGAFLGWRAVPGVLLLASIAGALFGVPFALRSDKGMQFALPFGVFLGLAGLAILFFGQPMTAWYLGLLQ